LCAASAASGASVSRRSSTMSSSFIESRRAYRMSARRRRRRQSILTATPHDRCPPFHTTDTLRAAPSSVTARSTAGRRRTRTRVRSMISQMTLDEARILKSIDRQDYGSRSKRTHEHDGYLGLRIGDDARRVTPRCARSDRRRRPFRPARDHRA
jgi:hypothetical protein